MRLAVKPSRPHTFHVLWTLRNALGALLCAPLALLPSHGKRLIYIATLYNYLSQYYIHKSESRSLQDELLVLLHQLNLEHVDVDALVFPARIKTRLWSRYHTAIEESLDLKANADTARFLLHKTPFWLRYRRELQSRDTQIILDNIHADYYPIPRDYRTDAEVSDFLQRQAG